MCYKNDQWTLLAVSRRKEECTKIGLAISDTEWIQAPSSEPLTGVPEVVIGSINLLKPILCISTGYEDPDLYLEDEDECTYKDVA